MELQLNECKDKHDQFKQLTDQGSTILYYDENWDELCANCANKKDMSTTVQKAEIYWEGPAIECTDCGNGIESTHGDPEEGKEEGEKIEFQGINGLETIRIPAHAVPIRRQDEKAVWPWNNGEYLITYGQKLVYRTRDKVPALWVLANLTGLCPFCNYPISQTLGKFCDHTLPVTTPSEPTVKQAIQNILEKADEAASRVTDPGAATFLLQKRNQFIDTWGLEDPEGEEN